MFRRYAALACLVAGAIVASCTSNNDSTGIKVQASTSTTVTITTIAPTTTTSTMAPSTTTTIVPGSANDPWGPIKCANVPHPAHHKPCVTAQRAKTVQAAPSTRVTPRQPKIVRSAPSGDLLGCLRHYESTNGATSSNLYQFQSGTWESAGEAAGSTYKGSASNASKAEQDKRAAAIIARDGVQGHWAAQKGRCF